MLTFYSFLFFVKFKAQLKANLCHISFKKLKHEDVQGFITISKINEQDSGLERAIVLLLLLL